jgi:hypothetical protein
VLKVKLPGVFYVRLNWDKGHAKILQGRLTPKFRGGGDQDIS